MAATSSAATRELLISVPADTEIAFSVPLNEPRGSASVKIIGAPGSTESRVDAFGAPLSADVEYTLVAGTDVVLMAWSTADIRIVGTPLLLRSVYRSSTCPISRSIVEYNCILHPLRDRADSTKTPGPITFICGSQHAGKHAIAKSLCNYASRVGWKPLLVDLDCSAAQSVGVPGTVGVGIVESPMTVDDVFSLTALTLTYFVGSTEAQQFSEDGKVSMYAPYAHYARQLLDHVQSRLAAHSIDLYGSSGAIVVLPELVDNAGATFIGELIQRYDVSNVLCVGDEFLFCKLLSKFATTQTTGKPSSSVQIDRLSQSFNTLTPPASDTLLPIAFHSFFHGSGPVDLYPSRWSKPFEQVEILQITEENGQPVLAAVGRDELQGIVGCICALFQHHKLGSALNTTPLAYARIQTIDAGGVDFFTSTHYTFPSERITAVIGTVRWITS